jgi:hypothetical protein
LGSGGLQREPFAAKRVAYRRGRQCQRSSPRQPCRKLIHNL